MKKSGLLATILFFSSPHSSAASPDVFLPFNLSSSRTYEAYLIDSHSGKCKAQERGSNNRYRVSVEPKLGYASVFIKKETDSYTKAALLSIEDVAQTNALDFATFKLYPDGHFEFEGALDNVQAFRTEKHEIERILASSPTKYLYLSRDIALKLAKERFEGSVKREILRRYALLFDIGQFKDIRSSLNGELDPTVYSYLTWPLFSYKASFSVSINDFVEITTQLRQTGFTPGGRCDPAVLDKHDKTSFFFSSENEICKTITTTTTIYEFSESRQTLKSVYRVEAKDGTVNNLFPSCTFLEIK